MKALSSILFQVCVLAASASATMGPFRGRAEAFSVTSVPANDTVVYPAGAYKLHRNLKLNEIRVVDTISGKVGYGISEQIADSSLRLSPRDSLKALLDSTLWDKIDSIYVADSTEKARIKFQQWYGSLSGKERRAYDAKQRGIAMQARNDSILKARDEQKQIRDSIVENTPRILETFAFPDTLQYKQIVSWTMDPDFQKMSVIKRDTTFNYRFNDYPFLREDVNATWLGVAGSPTQSYNFFKRDSREGVEFYDAYESWTFSEKTLARYNTKTPYTELSYTGTLLSPRAKESDNIHILTTQNILPELNFSLQFDRFGGGGMLENEETINKTFAAQSNYLGKKYMMHVGYIYNMVSLQENGGITDTEWVRDTTVEARDIGIMMKEAASRTKKHTVYLEQQLRIPFNFINSIRARRDSTFVFDADSLDRNITTAFIGHSSNFSTYTRQYRENKGDEVDSLRLAKLDNKVFLRLQPWSSEGVVSKLDVGVGDLLKTYYDPAQPLSGNHVENSAYLYAGLEGQLRDNFYWDAKARFVMAGHDAGDFGVRANAKLEIHPFRRDRKSPATIHAGFETTLREAAYYQRHVYSSLFSWDNDFSKISTTKILGEIDIPRWKFNASVGYALLGNRLYYDNYATIRQRQGVMSILSASVRKEFAFGPLHLDNRALIQFSSDNDVVPVPTAAFNLKYYFQFVVQKSEDRSQDIMVMQLGLNTLFNTKWHSPAWNPVLGVYYNQTDNLYNNGPYFDIFVNVQWKRACIFIKYQNAGKGWPMQDRDYFSSDRRIITQPGLDGLKLGIFWPFYTQPAGKAR